MNRALVIFLLSMGACSEGQPTSGAGVVQNTVTGSDPDQSAQPDTYSCGGETDFATVERYFSDLEKALALPGPKTQFNQFVMPQLTVRNRLGQTLDFNVEEIGSVTPSRVSVQDWREIVRRGERGLLGAGWRGCFFDSGKVWFQADGEHGFRLAGIAKDMPWVRPE